MDDDEAKTLVDETSFVLLAIIALAVLALAACGGLLYLAYAIFIG